MSAARRIESRELRCQTREPLHERIPLPTPWLLYLEPTNRCNFRCAFCPTGDPELLKRVGRSPCNLDWRLFQKVLKDLQAFSQPLKLLSLYKDGEPLLHPDFPRMVREARAVGIAERIWTKTNGARLNPGLNAELADCGLDLICISVESVSREGYLRISGVDFDYQAFRTHLLDLFRRPRNLEIHIKIVDSGLSPEDRERFFADFEDRCEFIGVEQLMGWSYSDLKDFKLGTQPETYDGLPFRPKEVCPYPFYVLAVNADGSVSVCGNDWSHGTVVGDVNRESLVDIWHGAALKDFQRKMLELRRSEIPVCATCDYLKIAPDHLDPHRESLLKRIVE